AFTVRPMATVRVKPPPVPVTVTVAGPVVAVPDAVKVNVVLFPVVEAGEKLAVTPAGSPLALKATLPVNPPVRAMVSVLVTLAPRLTARLFGLADSEKPGVLAPGSPTTMPRPLVET